MSNKLVQLADILPPALPTQNAASDWLIVVGAVLMLGIFLGLFKLIRPNPVQRTLRQLERGQLTPRQAAHTLARLQPSHELDQLRFQRCEPTLEQLQHLFASESSHG